MASAVHRRVGMVLPWSLNLLHGHKVNTVAPQSAAEYQLPKRMSGSPRRIFSLKSCLRAGIHVLTHAYLQVTCKYVPSHVHVHLDVSLCLYRGMREYRHAETSSRAHEKNKYIRLK